MRKDRVERLEEWLGDAAMQWTKRRGDRAAFLKSEGRGVKSQGNGKYLWWLARMLGHLGHLAVGIVALLVLDMVLSMRHAVHFRHVAVMLTIAACMIAFAIWAASSNEVHAAKTAALAATLTIIAAGYLVAQGGEKQ